jgi:hypothetical protein
MKSGSVATLASGSVATSAGGEMNLSADGAMNATAATIKLNVAASPTAPLQRQLPDDQKKTNRQVAKNANIEKI